MRHARARARAHQGPLQQTPPAERSCIPLALRALDEPDLARELRMRVEVDNVEHAPPETDAN
eukprot:7528746-Pyramimonas_sp.AAC.1